jgi:alkaline phosphatase D
VSFDGFRHDYQERFATPNLDRLEEQGVRAESLIPVYPSKTFPGHYSLATGLYPEHHGLVANVFYDPERKATYRDDDRQAVEDASWYRGEPIWVTAERQGVRAATFFWVGSEADIGGIAPTYRHMFDKRVSNEARVQGMLEWLELAPEERPHLVMGYFNLVDDAGHRYGPDALETAAAVQEADRLLGLILDGVESLSQRAAVYVVVVSDHGMATRDEVDYVDLDTLPGVRMVTSGAHANFFVDDGSDLTPADVRDGVAAALPHSEVYLRHDLPAELHHDDDPRAGDVIVVVGENRLVLPAGAPSERGNHGYHPRRSTMHGIFLARGPGIPEGKTIPTFELIHVYPWLAELLGVEPAAKIDGDPAVLGGLVVQSGSGS